MGVPIVEGSEDTIYTLLFADDQLLIAQWYEGMGFMVTTPLDEHEKNGFEYEFKKIKLLNGLCKINKKIICNLWLTAPKGVTPVN